MKQIFATTNPQTARQPTTTTTTSATGSAGWFRDHWQRLFGERDAVEAQLRDIARQGAFGARISHLFAALLIILFSTASLIALGADSMRAVLASLAHGTVDIPNAVATGVTALLVPAMDVAMLRAASKIRLLATRRATRREMSLHSAVMIVISLIEAGTYCYMAAIYEHPLGVVAWTLIAARAIAAPLIGVYLAMDRPHPVTSRDILAQVELGAGAGVIRDVTEIANDPEASLQRKMELYGASAVMRADEQRRLADLIAVAGKETGTEINKHSGATGLPSARIVAAGYVAPQTQPPQEHIVIANNMMHDWDIPDEVEDDDEDVGGWQTGVIEAIENVSSEDVPNAPKRRSRSQSNSGPKRSHQQASKAVRQTHKKMRLEAKQARKRAVRDGAFAIFDDLATSGDSLSNGEIGRRVRTMQHLETTPSDNTIARLRGAWKASRMHKATLEMDDATAALVSDETMAELEVAGALA